MVSYNFIFCHSVFLQEIHLDSAKYQDIHRRNQNNLSIKEIKDEYTSCKTRVSPNRSIDQEISANVVNKLMEENLLEKTKVNEDDVNDARNISEMPAESHTLAPIQTVRLMSGNNKQVIKKSIILT